MIVSTYIHMIATVVNKVFYFNEIFLNLILLFRLLFIVSEQMFGFLLTEQKFKNFGR
jgi:hypothetical protein